MPLTRAERRRDSKAAIGAESCKGVSQPLHGGANRHMRELSVTPDPFRPKVTFLAGMCENHVNSLKPPDSSSYGLEAVAMEATGMEELFFGGFPFRFAGRA